MAAIENVKKKLLTALLPQNEHIRTLTCKGQRDRPAEKAKAEAQVIIEQANKRRSQILDEAKAEAEQEHY